MTDLSGAIEVLRYNIAYILRYPHGISPTVRAMKIIERLEEAGYKIVKIDD